MTTALITGASAGLGLRFAERLAATGHDLVLIARTKDTLEVIAERLREQHGVQVEVLPADLSEPADVTRVAERLALGPASGTAPVDLLVNNAGFATNTHFVGGDLALENRGIHVMIRAIMELTHAALGQMTARDRGAVLNVGSVAALSAGGTYAAAKAWVRTFTESLAVELRGTHVTATVLAPGFTHTEYQQRAGIDKSKVPSIAWLDADRVVREGLRAVRRGATYCTPSVRYQVFSWTLRHFPRAYVRTIGKFGFAYEESPATTTAS